MARLPKSLREHLQHSPQAGSEAGLLNAAWEPVICDAERDDYHIQVAHAFARHVLKGTPMVADADDGIRQVELTNAAYLSGNLNRSVTFPVRGLTIERLLTQCIARSSRNGQGLRAMAKAAMRKLKQE